MPVDKKVELKENKKRISPNRNVDRLRNPVTEYDTLNRGSVKIKEHLLRQFILRNRNQLNIESEHLDRLLNNRLIKVWQGRILEDYYHAILEGWGDRFYTAISDNFIPMKLIDMGYKEEVYWGIRNNRLNDIIRIIVDPKLAKLGIFPSNRSMIDVKKSLKKYIERFS